MRRGERCEEVGVGGAEDMEVDEGEGGELAVWRGEAGQEVMRLVNQAL